MNWIATGKCRGVLECKFGDKVGHVVKLERDWLALYDGQIVAHAPSEVAACVAVEQRSML